MDNVVNTLLIVEGNKAEADFCKSMEMAFGLSLSICCLGTNIYTLYKKLKEYDFNADIKQVLEELHPEYHDILSKRFAYTYLIFDLDPHHPRRDDSRPLKKIISDNLKKISEMVSYFTNETDPTVGKLYINYPMLESFRDCDEPFDPNYRKEYVSIYDISGFKRHVSEKRMVGIHLDRYSREDFALLIKMNVYKLSDISACGWNSVSFKKYRDLSESGAILTIQTRLIQEKELIAVLNTSLFFILDYFGNKNCFYDKLILSQSARL